MKEEEIAKSIKNHIKSMYPNVVVRITDHVKHNHVVNLFDEDRHETDYIRFVDRWLAKFANVKGTIFIKFTVRPAIFGQYIICIHVFDWFYTCNKCGVKTDHTFDTEGLHTRCCPKCGVF